MGSFVTVGNIVSAENFLSAESIFAFFCWALAIAWLWKGLVVLRGMPQIPNLKEIDSAILPPIPSSPGPDLTVIVPARNEEASIEACLRALLASTGIRLQIIAVDDRSTDRTGACMDAIAADASHSISGHQFDVIHITEIPAGWLGKPHAMFTAAQRATAPWILFTDGDVICAPPALSLALREATALRADHMVLVPTLTLRSIGERSVFAAMQALALWLVRLWKVSDPRAGDFIGAGGFNMLRRDVYRQIGGFESLRMEVLEDVYLGKRVKHAGFSQHVVVGPGLINIRWIISALAVIHLVEKNGFAVTRYRTGLHLLACLAFLIDALVPLLAIACGGWTMVAGLATYLGIALAYHGSKRVTGVSAVYALAFAPAVLIVAYAFFRSMILALARRGVTWRGTRYPLADLRQSAHHHKSE